VGRCCLKTTNKQTNSNTNNTNNTYQSQPLLTNRGYTGHEHIGEMGMIHMNGRVYDPIIGRFLSPDPFVQYPYKSQSYNRYAYVRNNPLKYTDPSGYCDDGEDTSGWDGGGSSGLFGGSDGDGSSSWGGGYADGEAEESWYNDNVYDKEDKAYNNAFSGGTPSLTQINPSWRYASQIQSRYRQNYFGINKVNNKSNISFNPMSITVAPIGVKLGIANFSIEPATLLIVGNNIILSERASLTVLGFGGYVENKSYDFGRSWSGYNYGYETDWKIKDGLNYQGGFGIQGFGFDATYDFEFEVVSPAY
jgi:RHS repeat-associated protein